MNKKLFSFLFVFVLMISLASAAHPAIINFDEGLSIVTSPIENIFTGKAHMLNFFVQNSTNGIALDNTTVNCTFYLDYVNGTVQYSSDVGYNPNGYWGIGIAGSNLETIGEQPWRIYCNDGTHGGQTVGSWYTTNGGLPPAEGNVLALFILLAFIMFVGTAWVTLKNFERGVELDVDLTDVVKSFMSFGLFLLFYWFAWNYWGDIFILELLEVSLWVVGFMNLFVVAVMFGFSLLKRIGDGQ